MPELTPEELDDLVDRWHDEPTSQSLEDWIRGHTGWTAEQFGRWVATGHA